MITNATYLQAIGSAVVVILLFSKYQDILTFAVVSTIKKIELLSPARDLSAAMAAIDCGADAVYMGGPGFGARKAAGNSIEDIARVVEYARPFGVRVYAALNTLLYDHELKEAQRIAGELVSAGVSAFIVQDMAYMEMGIEGVEYHASTQTYNTSPEYVRFLYESGFSRVILERSLSYAQILEIAAASDAELEFFVHGALCVSRSGRCYMSRTMSQRSGNRGDCSQPCRLSYDLIDEHGKEIIHGKHILSLKDLDLSSRIGDLLDAGITSFKIEGRLKDNDYVKNTTAYFRRRLDQEIARRPGMERSSQGVTTVDFAPDLSKTFSRTGTRFFIDGGWRGMASFDTPKAKGEPLGMVARSGPGWFETEREVSVGSGDGICYLSGEELTGMNINKVEGMRIFTNRSSIIIPGTEVFRNFDRSFSLQLERSRTRRTIDAAANFSYGGGIVTLSFTDIDGNSVRKEYAGDWPPAGNRDKMAGTIAAQLFKSGDSIFRVRDIAVGEGALPFIPASQLNAMRREMLKELLAVRASAPIPLNMKTADRAFPYPKTEIMADGNVTNRLAEQFYRSHGVEDIAPGLELRDTMHGECVMSTPYCIRREIGECLREKPSVRGGLFLRRGSHTYRLDFDCGRCEMRIVFMDRIEKDLDSFLINSEIWTD